MTLTFVTSQFNLQLPVSGVALTERECKLKIASNFATFFCLSQNLNFLQNGNILGSRAPCALP